MHITLPEDGGEDEYDEERHFAPIILALQAMIAVNEYHIRRSIRRAQKGLGAPIPPLYASGVRYKEDPPGEENWKDCLAVLKDGHGDCLPLSTLVLRRRWEDVALVPLLAIRAGDQIMGDGTWTEVRDACLTGGKRVLAMHLANGCVLRCSREHRLFRVVAGRREEVRAGDVHLGDDLVSPEAICADLPVEIHAQTPPAILHAISNARRRRVPVHRVERIGELGSVACMDITTESGSFWLPESDVLVHNCDRLVSWRVAELRCAGIQADPIIKWQQVPRDIMIGMGHPPHMVPPEGISMVHVCVGWPGWQQDESRVEDPSKLLGMGGNYTSKI